MAENTNEKCGGVAVAALLGSGMRFARTRPTEEPCDARENFDKNNAH